MKAPARLDSKVAARLGYLTENDEGPDIQAFMGRYYATASDIECDSGVITVAFRDRLHGIIGGGELAQPNDFTDNVASSRDGGKTWTLQSRPPFPGSIYGLSYVPGLGATVVATGKDPACAASWSAMRPPHPVALGPAETADCSWPCWSECENRLSGRFAR